MRWIVAASLLGLLGFPVAQAQEWPEVPPPPELEGDAPPPVIDERARERQLIEDADITIVERPDATIREYRLGGQLFMVEVVPRVGRPYYLIDTTGDGVLDTHRHGIGPDFVPPQWILFRW